jgi:hypothetical protein
MGMSALHKYIDPTFIHTKCHKIPYPNGIKKYESPNHRYSNFVPKKERYQINNGKEGVMGLGICGCVNSSIMDKGLQ